MLSEPALVRWICGYDAKTLSRDKPGSLVGILTSILLGEVPVDPGKRSGGHRWRGQSPGSRLSRRSVSSAGCAQPDRGHPSSHIPEMILVIYKLARPSSAAIPPRGLGYLY
jgi:hypothetical protein